MENYLPKKRGLLKKVAKEEGINETDAEVYIIGELKSKVKENEKRNAPLEKVSLVKDSLEIGGFLLDYNNDSLTIY